MTKGFSFSPYLPPGTHMTLSGGVPMSSRVGTHFEPFPTTILAPGEKKIVDFILQLQYFQPFEMHFHTPDDWTGDESCRHCGAPADEGKACKHCHVTYRIPRAAPASLRSLWVLSLKFHVRAQIWTARPAVMFKNKDHNPQYETLKCGEAAQLELENRGSAPLTVDAGLEGRAVFSS